jgi:hypothetical protein
MVPVKPNIALLLMDIMVAADAAIMVGDIISPDGYVSTN